MGLRLIPAVPDSQQNSSIAAKGHGRLGKPAVRQEVWTQEWPDDGKVMQSDREHAWPFLSDELSDSLSPFCVDACNGLQLKDPRQLLRDDLIFYIKTELYKKNFDILSMKESQDCVKAVGFSPPGITLSSWEWPKIDGTHVLRELLEIYPQSN